MLSTASAPSTPRRQGPKRSEASRLAILSAAREEMTEKGWRKFSVDNLATRASVSKQTIYRWWPSIGALCVDAALQIMPEHEDTGFSPQQRLAAIFIPLEHFIRATGGHRLLRATLVAAADDEDAGEAWRAWMTENLRQPVRLLLAELAGKKIIHRDWDIDLILSRMIGPVWHHLLASNNPLPLAYSERMAIGILRGLELKS